MRFKRCKKTQGCSFLGFLQNRTSEINLLLSCVRIAKMCFKILCHMEDGASSLGMKKKKKINNLQTFGSHDPEGPKGKGNPVHDLVAPMRFWCYCPYFP